LQIVSRLHCDTGLFVRVFDSHELCLLADGSQDYQRMSGFVVKDVIWLLSKQAGR
jgi:hypothetical protein